MRARAIAGAMALNAHGYRRVTTNVDVLLTREGRDELEKRHVGLGRVERFAGSKNLRDTETGVKIDVLIACDYPGDGKPKSVAFLTRPSRRRARASVFCPSAISSSSSSLRG